MNPRPPFPPFTEETARQKVQAAEDAWNTREPERVALAYTEDSVWRNRDEFVTGRAGIVEFLRRKWSRELDYALRKELWSFDGNRIAVRFQYESHNSRGQWFRSYGNELWEFTGEGLMRRRGPASTTWPSTRRTGASTARGQRASVARPSRCADTCRSGRDRDYAGFSADLDRLSGRVGAVDIGVPYRVLAT